MSRSTEVGHSFVFDHIEQFYFQYAFMYHKIITKNIKHEAHRMVETTHIRVR